MARRMSLRPVNSTKNIVDVSGVLAIGSTTSVNLVDAVQSLSDPPQPSQVQKASTVSSIYLSVFVLGNSGSASGLVDWYVWKDAGGSNQASPDTPTAGNTNASNLKRFIFHEEKGLAATQDGTPMVFKGVIRIPPRFRRMGQNDIIQLRLLSPVADMQFCVKAIYKWYQ